MKVYELTGADLDRWAASIDPRCEGCAIESVQDDDCGSHYVGRCEDGVAFFIPRRDKVLQVLRLKRKYPHADAYSPSSDWRDGGRIIDLKRIAVAPVGVGWSATLIPKFVCMDGDTALVAAVRCFIAAAYGDEVPHNSTSTTPPAA